MAGRCERASSSLSLVWPPKLVRIKFDICLIFIMWILTSSFLTNVVLKVSIAGVMASLKAAPAPSSLGLLRGPLVTCLLFNPFGQSPTQRHNLEQWLTKG